MKNNRFIYHIKGIANYLYPKRLLNKDEILSNVESRADFKEIVERVDYYNKLDLPFQALDFNDTNPNADSKIPQSMPIKLADFKIPKKKINYFFDTYEFTRYFDKNLKIILESGDVNYNLALPSICKSRPIQGNNKNNVLLNLDKIRHFLFIKDPYRFEDKDDILYFRGGVYQQHRIKFLEHYFSDSRCDLGHTGSISDYNARFVKPKVGIKEHLKHKFILSLEGNDVASNLKWIMSSNSIAVSPKLRFETWFMEGQLKGDFHYIEIDDDYSNVFEKIDFYIKNPKSAKQIIKNANDYCRRFYDKEREKIISLLVLEKYFKYARFYEI